MVPPSVTPGGDPSQSPVRPGSTPTDRRLDRPGRDWSQDHRTIESCGQSRPGGGGSSRTSRTQTCSQDSVTSCSGRDDPHRVPVPGSIKEGRGPGGSRPALPTHKRRQIPSVVCPWVRVSSGPPWDPVRGGKGLLLPWGRVPSVTRQRTGECQVSSKGQGEGTSRTSVSGEEGDVR